MNFGAINLIALVMSDRVWVCGMVCGTRTHVYILCLRNIDYSFYCVRVVNNVGVLRRYYERNHSWWTSNYEWSLDDNDSTVTNVCYVLCYLFISHWNHWCKSEKSVTYYGSRNGVDLKRKRKLTGASYYVVPEWDVEWKKRGKEFFYNLIVDLLLKVWTLKNSENKDVNVKRWEDLFVLIFSQRNCEQNNFIWSNFLICKATKVYYFSIQLFGCSFTLLVLQNMYFCCCHLWKWVIKTKSEILMRFRTDTWVRKHRNM